MELVNRTLEEFIELNVAGLSETDNQSCESSPAPKLFSGPFLTRDIRKACLGQRRAHLPPQAGREAKTMDVKIGDGLFLSSGKEAFILRATPCHEDRTNADRIRGMSDGELADYVFAVQKQMCERFANIIGFTEPLQFVSSAPDLLDWLRQPTEEVHDEKCSV